MNVDQLAGTDMSTRASHPAAALNDGTALEPLLGLEELRANPDYFVILCMDEDTAHTVAIIWPGFVCLLMDPVHLENTDYEPLRGRRVYVWPHKDGAVGDDDVQVMRMLEEEFDAKIPTPSEFLNILV